MAVTTEILATYRAPREVMRRQLAGGVREDRALIYLMVACALVFVAQWPRLSREAALNPDLPLDALVGAALLGWMFLAPLLFYALAGLAHVIARLLGGSGSWYTARLALFWTLLAVSPLWLLHGLVAGFVGPGTGLSLTGVVLLGTIALLWGSAIVETEFSRSSMNAPESN